MVKVGLGSSVKVSVGEGTAVTVWVAVAEGIGLVVAAGRRVESAGAMQPDNRQIKTANQIRLTPRRITPC